LVQRTESKDVSLRSSCSTLATLLLAACHFSDDVHYLQVIRQALAGISAEDHVAIDFNVKDLEAADRARNKSQSTEGSRT
jgi:hypothetical protein